MTISVSSDHFEPRSMLLRATTLAAWALLIGALSTAARRGFKVPEHVLAADGPPDLDELWRDFNRKLSGLFGGKGTPRRPAPEGGGGPSFQPSMRNAGVGVALIAGVLVLVWAFSGLFNVQEGEQAVVTTFGKYSRTVDAGLNYRWPYPFQAHETEKFTQLRSVEVGKATVNTATGLRDSSMLTQDENIVDIRFTVQYRLKDLRAFLFNNQMPEAAVILAAESAVREIIGKTKIDSVLYEGRDAIAPGLVKSIQAQLDRLNAGILVVNVNVQSVQPPEQVQAAFDDTLKAGQDGDRLKKEGLAYASDVIPKAQGEAARLREQAEGYRSSVVAQATGDAERFSRVLVEYQKAPAVTRDRIYIDTMRQVYSNVTKVLIDARNNNTLLNLPLDKLMQQVAAGAPPVGSPSATAGAATSTPDSTPPNTGSVDIRSRDNQRSREREQR